MARYDLYYDGSCEPVNPGGVAAYGFLLHRDGQLLTKECGMAAEPGSARATNNVAEYTALIRGLDAVLAVAVTGDRMVAAGDSMLTVRQSLGIWRAKSPNTIELSRAAKDRLNALRDRGVQVDLIWIPRRLNSEADALSRLTLRDEVRRDPKRILDIRMPWGKFKREKMSDLPDSYYRWVWDRVPDLMPERAEPVPVPPPEPDLFSNQLGDFFGKDRGPAKIQEA
jgi:ribonuclease HI